MKPGDCLQSTPEFLLRLLLKQHDRRGLDHIPVSVFTQIPGEDGRVERHKFNIGTRQLSHIRHPVPVPARATCVLWRDSLVFVISQLSAHRSSAWFCSNCGCFSCSQVTNHSSRDKMLVFNQTVLLCSNFVCSCRLICWMMLRLFSSCRAGDWFVARISKNESRFVLILYSRKVSCRKVSLSRTRCAGRGLGLVPLRFPLVPLNWISDDIRKNHLVH